MRRTVTTLGVALSTMMYPLLIMPGVDGLCEGIFGPREAASLYGVASDVVLLGCRLDLHRPKLTCLLRSPQSAQATPWSLNHACTLPQASLAASGR